ncbi:uncharacterized protein LOC141902581 [Tubulanus polymorphus]|uniref:uncharacterized protein LOC141902581 n=1 Tax=Tubulanus polymorphus TaxID=672921 RepID=UPI003DA66E25
MSNHRVSGGDLTQQASVTSMTSQSSSRGRNSSTGERKTSGGKQSSARSSGKSLLADTSGTSLTSMPNSPRMKNVASKSPSQRSASKSPSRTSSNAKSPHGSNTQDSLPKPRRRRKKGKTDDEHRVIFTVTVAQAIPTVKADDQPDVTALVKRKKRIVEAPRAQNYYHCEYFLLPDDDEPVRTDVVTFGMAAKIYPDKQEPKVLKTWQDGDQTWVVWSHSHTIIMTEEVLLKLCKHDLDLRIWDMKEKCSSRAKFDRPKAFKLPSAKGEDTDDIGGVKSMVLKQAKNFLKSQPKKLVIERPLPSMSKIAFDENGMLITTDMSDVGTPAPRDDKAKGKSADEQLNTAPSELISIQTRDRPGGKVSEEGTRTYSRLGELAGIKPPKEPKKEKAGPTKRSRRTQNDSSDDEMYTKSAAVPKHGKNNVYSSGNNLEGHDAEDTPGSAPPGTGSTVGFRRRKKDPLAQAQAEYVKKHGIATIKVRLAELFADKLTITSRLEKSVTTIDDMFVTVTIDKQIMSDEQRLKFNPIVVKVHSATNMPETPISHMDLNQRCHPVFCKYKFFTEDEHTSIGRDHRHNIYWDDVTVFFTGTMDKSELRQYLTGPPLTIEVHDRDRKYVEEKLKPTLFGDDLEDEKISNVGTVGSRRTIYNPYLDREKPWDPYGLAKFDLSGLLLGQKVLELASPIQPCAMPDPLGIKEGKMDGKLLGVTGAVDGPVETPLQSGHYLQGGASLKILVEIAHTLTNAAEVAENVDLETTTECPFARIIFKFDYKNATFLHKIQNLITEINAKALQLDDLPDTVVSVALSTYKLSRQQQQSRDLDIVTGFHVMDGKRHVFVLEGLRDSAIKLLWESLPKLENSDVTVLYHTDMCFSDRLYTALDVDLCRVKLHEPLDIIVQQPLLYIRDMVPRPCFQALIKLHDLLSMDLLRNAVRNELFPSAEMVVSMSKEFGVPLTSEDFEDLQPVSHDGKDAMDDPNGWMNNIGPSHVHTPIDNFNDLYVTALEKRLTEDVKDFKQENMEEIRKKSDENRRNKKCPVTLHADQQPAHNYSVQSLNSTELAKDKLRQLLSEDPDRRYTYCQKYHHSMTVLPVNIDKLRKDQENHSRARWQTQNGFVYPGVKSTIDSNIHAKKPVEPRTDELKMPWIENSLHTSIMQAPLDRGRFSWNYRHNDMNLWRRPMENFGNQIPITIHEAGDKLEQEKISAVEKSYQEWLSKIIVDSMGTKSHRCLPATELTHKGFKSSNQLDRLQGLLKNEPQKVALRRPGMRLREVPPLSVVSNPSVDTASRNLGLRLPPAFNANIEKTKGFAPGPFAHKSWVNESNKIPIRYYDHSKYAASKGHDFNVYHKERDVLSWRPIIPLNEEERDNHLFWLYNQSTSNTCPELVSGHGIDSGFGSSDAATGEYTLDPTLAVSSHIEKQSIGCAE